MSLYEGRTRGKRIRYNYSDDEDGASDAMSGRRSRNSGITTPAEPAGPVVTASGRHIKPRAGGLYGESLLSGQQEDAQQTYTNSTAGEDVLQENGGRTRSRQAAGTSRAGRAYHRSYNAVDEMEDESDAPSSEWDSGKEDDEDVDDKLAEDDEDEEMSDEGSDEDEEQGAKGSLVVSLKIGKSKAAWLKAETPDQLVPEEHAITNGASPAGSTIILNNTGTKTSGATVPSEVHPTPPTAETLKFDSATPISNAIQAPTPPLSDNLQSANLNGSSVPTSRSDLDSAAQETSHYSPNLKGAAVPTRSNLDFTARGMSYDSAKLNGVSITTTHTGLDSKTQGIDYHGS